MHNQGESKPYDGTECPSCGDDNINGDEIEPSGPSLAYRNCDCTNCGATWTERLEVQGFSELEEHKPD